ncbi:MAG: helix-turn-helix domain-containing protein [Chloroflexi bacterium]|nr:helix-turn-helix domain-containing protein [Chloroflexota bacterium]
MKTTYFKCMAAVGRADDGFGALLRRLRVRVGLSQNQLARRAGVDPAYVNRLERAAPGSSSLPSRRVVLGFAEALELGPADGERLLVAAGLCPETILRLGGWDPSLGLVAGVLSNPELTADDLAEFRELLRIVASRWGAAS